jgi:DNA-binding NtrC family response regulator
MNSQTRPIVLCVDDEDSQLALRKMLFEGAGFEFLGAQSGAAALELFRSKEIAAVVLDYWMSEMKGTEIAAEMKRQRPKVPIIVLSGFALLPGEASLVNAWFQKGRIQPDELVREIRRLLDHSSNTQQNPSS